MPSVLGISLGTRHVGYALVNDSELLDWGIKSSLDTWSPKKLKKILHIVETLLDLNGVQNVAIKIPDILPNSRGFHELIGSLNVLLESKDIKATYYPLSRLKKQFCSNPKANKKELIAAILTLYPELKNEQEKENRNEIAYYAKIFEAVAAARMP